MACVVIHLPILGLKQTRILLELVDDSAEFVHAVRRVAA
jgi:hypothetical protein